MELWNKLGETIATAGRDVSQMAKDLSGTAKLNLDIRAKEDFIQKQYAEIGKMYYDAHKDDPETPYEQILTINEAFAAIAQMKKELLEIKGAKQCPKCGAQMAEDAGFCSSCGAKLDIFEEE